MFWYNLDFIICGSLKYMCIIVIILFYLKKKKNINLILRVGRLKKVIVLQSRVMKVVEISFLMVFVSKVTKGYPDTQNDNFWGSFPLVSRFNPQKNPAIL